MRAVAVEPDVAGIFARRVDGDAVGSGDRTRAGAEHAELGGGICWDGGNYCLHKHEFFKTFDLFGIGKPTRVAFASRDVREDDARIDPSAQICCFAVPWFKHYDTEWIETYAAAYRKVIENYEQLLEKDDDNSQGGRWYGQSNNE